MDDKQQTLITGDKKMLHKDWVSKEERLQALRRPLKRHWLLRWLPC